MSQPIIASLARIADFDSTPYGASEIHFDNWQTGDYVLGRATRVPDAYSGIEDRYGTMVPVRDGDLVIGAIGDRAATLEGVGRWRDVVGGSMDAMTSAALFGKLTSVSSFMPDAASFDYAGHITRSGKAVRMSEFAIRAESHQFSIPTVLITGTSMSAGKTMTGVLACKILSAMGLNVIATKLTGAGRYRDILSFERSGANRIFDFVDAGMPSTIVPEHEYRAAIRPLLGRINGLNPDVMIAEAGASPLEPYNGEAILDELGDNVRCRILAASDPYAVHGVMAAFRFTPDLVTGPATNTSAAIDLLRKLTGLPGINILDPESEADFARFILGSLNLSAPGRDQPATGAGHRAELE